MKSRYLLCFAVFMIACLTCGPALAQWTTYQGDANHDGYVPVSLNPAGFSVQWQRSLTTSALNPVAAANGEVFVSAPTRYIDGMRLLRVLDAATGQTKWSIEYTNAYSVSPPAYANGKVYIQTCNHATDTHLRAYDAISGSLVYDAPFDAQWETYLTPTIYDNTVYINGGRYGGMYAFDGSSGQQKWFMELVQRDGWTPAVDANYAYVYSGRDLLALDRATGLVAFRITDSANPWDDECQTVILGSHNDAFAFVTYRLVCFDLQNKKVKWELPMGQPSVAKGVVYAIESGKLNAVDEDTGSLLWTWTPPTGGLAGKVIVTNTHALVSSADATYAVDLKTHAGVWSYPLGGPLALSDRALYIASSTGTLAAIAIPPTSMYPVAPSALSMKAAKPAVSPVYVGNATSIELSGTADELDSHGAVLGTGCLASVTWSNNRGGSGTGCFDSSWNTPTAWSASGIALQPGDNVITVTAVDLWGNTATTSVTVKAPTGLKLAITNPTSEPACVADNTPITLSGTANGIDSSGIVRENAGLASIAWSSNRGGTGTGTFSDPSTTPTTWSIEGVALQPGDNVITVTATDLWGNTATDVITVTAPSALAIAITSPTSEPGYRTSGTPISLSGTANDILPAGVTVGGATLASLKWSNDRGGSGTGTYTSASTKPTTWTISTIGLQAGDNVITVTATDVWGNTATAVITATWTPGSVGAARKLASGKLAYVENAVVTAVNVPSGSVFVESADRSAGIRLVTTRVLNIGDVVSFTGTLNRTNGEYQISGLNFLTVDSGTPLAPLYLSSHSIGNDKRETLSYTGLNTTGLFVKTFGKVTGTVTTASFFYIDDGGLYEDGVGPVRGLRVYVPTGVTMPRSGKWVSVTGISRVEKFTLTGWAEVNGDFYGSGTVVYFPSIWVRNASDIQVLQ